METKTKKITRATLKSFIKKNERRLYIRNDSDFDGMIDCVSNNNTATFQPVKPSKKEFTKNRDLGIEGLWLVGSSRDYFSHYEDAYYKGIVISNSCGSDVIAISK